MNWVKNDYIKYTKAELEEYINNNESCVKKITSVEELRISPISFNDFQASILKILSRKIGKFDIKLNGIVLDFRNTKVLNNQSVIRQDSPYSVINVETNFYVFVPETGIIVNGVVKFISRTNMETIISVVIYRVFNVKITIKGEAPRLEKEQEIKIKIKDFHFRNVIPYIEGDIVDLGLATGIKILFEDTADSGISESSVTSESQKAGPSGLQKIAIKKERESSVESEEIVKSKKTPKKKRKASEIESPEKKPEVPHTAKKIKMEPVLSSDDDQLVKNIKQEKNDSDTFSHKTKSQEKPSKSNKLDKISLIAASSTTNENVNSTHTKKNKKSKKKKPLEDLDDFETSLQLLLSSAQIKKE